MIEIINEPDTYLMQAAFLDLQAEIHYAPASARTFDGWISYFESVHVHYEPIIILDSGSTAAVIWFTNYDAESSMAEVHFIARRTANPVAVHRAVNRVLSDIGASGDIAVVLGIMPTGNKAAIRTAKSFGMKEFAYTDRLVYTAKEL